MPPLDSIAEREKSAPLGGGDQNGYGTLIEKAIDGANSVADNSSKNMLSNIKATTEGSSPTKAKGGKSPPPQKSK